MLAQEETSQGLSTTHAILTAELILGLFKAIHESGFFSKRDIQEGEELTFNYQLQQSSDEGKTKCLCGSKNCAGFIGDKVKNEKSESQNAKKSKISKKRKQASRTSAAPNDTSISQVTKRRKLA